MSQTAREESEYQIQRPGPPPRNRCPMPTVSPTRLSAEPFINLPHQHTDPLSPSATSRPTFRVNFEFESLLPHSNLLTYSVAGWVTDDLVAISTGVYKLPYGPCVQTDPTSSGSQTWALPQRTVLSRTAIIKSTPTKFGVWSLHSCSLWVSSIMVLLHWGCYSPARRNLEMSRRTVGWPGTVPQSNAFHSLS